MIDTHSHIYAKDFDADFLEMMARAKAENIHKIYLPNIDVESITPLKNVAKQHPHCLPMMGLHPGSVKADWEHQLNVILQELDKPELNYCAVGEIGMDLYWDKTFVEAQKVVFKKQIQKSKELDLPIVIHCRDAFDEIFEVLESERDEKLHGVLHCFTGTIDHAKQALSLNLKLGIGGVVTFKNSGLDAVVAQLKLDDLVLETDAPYLAPTPYRGKRNEPAYLSQVCTKLASIFNCPAGHVDTVTTANALAIFEPSTK